MDFKRDIYASLLQWKKNNSGKVLEVSGARQVGKTYILTKFAKENYKKFIYINMMQTSGQEFIACLDKASRWEPGEERVKQPIHKAFALFDCKLMKYKSLQGYIRLSDSLQGNFGRISSLQAVTLERQCKKNISFRPEILRQ